MHQRRGRESGVYAFLAATRGSGGGRLSVCRVLVWLLFAGPPESAQPKDPRNRESRKASVLGFLDANRAHDYARALHVLDLRKLSAARRWKDGPELARKLGEVLNRDAEFDVAELSRDPEGGHTGGLAPDRERVDSFTVDGKSVDLEMQRVTLRNKLSIWLFSTDSVARIPRLAQLTSDSPLEKY